MRYVSLFTLLALLFTACHSVRTTWLEETEVYRLSETSYPPLPPDAPVRLTTGDLETAYEEVAIIAVGPPFSLDFRRSMLDQLNRKLQEQAREIGANAVIRIDYDLQSGSEATPSAIGTAVRIPKP